MTIKRSEDRYNKYKKQVKEVWDERYGRHIVRTVHQAGDDAETNINLAKLEVDLFLNPEYKKCIDLHDNKEIRKCPPTFSKNFHRHKPLEDYIGKLSKCKVLDYGCGSLARYTQSFSPIFKEVVGVDSSPAAVGNCQQYVKDLDNVTIVEVNGIDLLGFDDNNFDFVFSNLVFQHVGNKEVLEDLINESYRILKKPGVMRASFWTEEKEDAHENVYNGTGFSLDGYKEVFEKAGFVVETMTHSNPVLWITALKE